MTTLEQQTHDNVKTSHEILIQVCEKLGIEERGGGPEGLYYTHDSINGEYLYRNLPILVEEVFTLFI